MASSGSITTSAYTLHTDGTTRSITLNWSIKSQNATTNTSVIAWSLVGSGSASGWVRAGDFVAKINGTTVYNNSTRIQVYKDTSIASGEITVAHNSDGSKTVAMSVSASIYYSDVTYSGSGNAVLTTIPRASSVSSTNAEIGKSITITINRASSSFTHTLKYTLGSASGTIVTKTANTKVTYTLPTSLYAQITTAKSKSGTITCDTYNGSTKVGSKTCSFTASVGSGSAPTISSLAITYSAYQYTGSHTKILKGYGGISAQATVSYKDSASQKSLVYSNSGKNSTDNPATFTNITDGKVTAVATDSRGYTASKSTTLTIIPYVKPTITLSSGKLDTEGKITFKLAGYVYQGSLGTETNTCQLQYRIAGGDWVDVTPTFDEANQKYTKTLTLTGYDYKQEYKIEAKISDTIYQVNGGSITVNCFPIFDWSKSDFNFNVPVTVSQSPSVGYFHTKGNYKLGVGVGSNSTNRGIYDYGDNGGLGDWLVKLDSSNKAVIAGADLSYRNPVANKTVKLCYNAGDTITIGSDSIYYGYITNGKKSMYFYIPLPCPIIANSATVTGSIMVRGINGYCPSSSAINLTTPSGFTKTVNITGNRGIEIKLDYSSEITNTTNNTPITVSTISSGCGLTITLA